MILRWKEWLTLYGKILRLIVLVLLAFVYSMFQGGFVSWFVFYSFLPFALYALLLIFYPLHKVRISRQFKNTNFRAGDCMQVEVHIQRPWFIPLVYIIVEDELSPRLQVHNQPCRMVLFPFFRKRMIFSYEVNALVRGDYRLEYFSLTVGDFLGLFEKKIKIQCVDHVIVYPNYELLSYQRLQAVMEEGRKTVTSHNRRDTAIISGVRNYVPGDKMSWVHWKATARKNELMTKEFEDSASRDALIVLDQTTSELFEERISYVASLAHSLLQRGGVAVAYTNTDCLQEPLVFGRGSLQKEKILYTLVQEEIADVGSKELSTQIVPYYQAECLIVTTKVSKELLTAINQLKGKNAATVIVMKNNLNEVDNSNVMLAKQGVGCRYITPISYRDGDVG